MILFAGESCVGWSDSVLFFTSVSNVPDSCIWVWEGPGRAPIACKLADLWGCLMRQTPSGTAAGDEVDSLTGATWREKTNSVALRCRLPLDS